MTGAGYSGVPILSGHGTSAVFRRSRTWQHRAAGERACFRWTGPVPPQTLKNVGDANRMVNERGSFRARLLLTESLSACCEILY